MSYSLQGILIVAVLACTLMAEALWSSLRNDKNFTHSIAKSLATGGGFAVYAAIDYLMIAPGANYLMT